MPDLEQLAHDTCHVFLTASQLRAICHHRGFPCPTGGKEKLAEFIAPRLLETAGLRQAMASLGEEALVLLHRIALAGEPVRVSELRPVLAAFSGRWLDDGPTFRRIAEQLLNRGVVLAGERTVFRTTTRAERSLFHLPPGHVPFLPPFPVRTRPMKTATAAGPLAICRRAIVLATAAAVDGGDESSRRKRKAAGDDDLARRVARTITFTDGTLRIGSAPRSTVSAIISHVRGLWTHRSSKSGPLHRALATASHVLSHLPEATGVTVDDLHEAVERSGFKADSMQLARWCDEGAEAGFLVRDGRAGRRTYAANDVSDQPGDSQPLAFRPIDGGVEVEVERTGLEPLLALSAVCRVEPAGGALRLMPDIAALGRNAERLDSLAPLRDVRSSSPEFEAAVDHVKRRHKKLIVHDGLLVLRIEDLGLRALLDRKLGDTVRALGGPYLAVPRGLLPKVEKLVRGKGFAPRRVS